MVSNNQLINPNWLGAPPCLWPIQKDRWIHKARIPGE